MDYNSAECECKACFTLETTEEAKASGTRQHILGLLS